MSQSEQQRATGQPVIIEVAINGATSKAVNPNVPKTADEIAADALAVLEAGASIVHAHCDPMGGPDDEVAERYLAAFRQVWAERPDALLYPTINMLGTQLSFGHLRPLAAAGMRVGFLDPGSLNFGRRTDAGVPGGSFVYSNSYDRIEEVLTLHDELGLGPSLAIYEPGFLRVALQYWKAGRLPAGTMAKLYLATDDGIGGVPFGLPPTVAALDAYLELLDGTPIPWAVSVVGGDLGRSDIAPVVLERGGHLHIGLEFYGGDRQPTNAELLAEAVALCEQAGRPPASCDDAARILDLPAPAAA